MPVIDPGAFRVVLARVQTDNRADRPASTTNGFAMPSDLPRLERTGEHTRLIVDGAPFLSLGGELHNSSSSDAHHMASIWEKVGRSGLNSLVASIGWDQVEPREGQFDFTVVDDLLAGARGAGLRVVLIWFGAFKNAHSTYAPTWVRADVERFPRADRGPDPYPAPFTYEGSLPRPTLSVFSPALVAADRAAYSALVEHLRVGDEQHTVIMLQVENEVGLLGVGRDRSADAVTAWNAPVPAELLVAVADRAHDVHADLVSLFADGKDASLSWADRFGEGDHVADEAFMAWAFGRYVGALAAAGKAIKALPAYANAWLGPQPGQSLPGQYPSGGPTARMGGVWRAAAPAIDFLAPDIYIPGARAVMEEYTTAGNPLFIPEAQFLTGNAFLAVGAFGGFGFHVFGLDDAREGTQYADGCRKLLSLTQQIVDAQRDGRILGFALEPDEDSVSAVIDGTTITVRNAPKLVGQMLMDVGVQLPAPAPRASETVDGAHGIQPADARPFGIVIATGPMEYLVVGQAAMIDFARPGAVLEIDTVRELRHTTGGWVEGRILNGDERLTVLGANEITAARITVIARPA